MYGAILGDIAGSRFEFSHPQGFCAKKEVLFAPSSRYTDDTVMTIATKYAVLTGTSYAKAYGSFGRRYKKAGYGPLFLTWLDNRSEKGYNSYGNGAAMRVSFLGHYYNSLREVEREAKKSAECTHNHPEGIKGAVCVAGCVFLAEHGATKKQILHYAKEFGYHKLYPLWVRRPFEKFDLTCQHSVPLALRCFLESNSWEECIRNVYSVHCDTDTIAAIDGGIADSFFHGTGFEEERLLRHYLVKPTAQGTTDTFLYDWAVKEWRNTTYDR